VIILRALQQLAVACARTGFGGEPLDPVAEEALAKLDSLPPPLPAFSSALRELAAGTFPSSSTGLPNELREILETLTQALRDASPR
jgi:hypothetical protein